MLIIVNAATKGNSFNVYGILFFETGTFNQGLGNHCWSSRLDQTILEKENPTYLLAHLKACIKAKAGRYPIHVDLFQEYV